MLLNTGMREGTHATDTQISAINRHAQCPSNKPEAAAVVCINPLQTGSKLTKSYLIIARVSLHEEKSTKKKKQSPPCTLVIQFLISQNNH